MSAVLEYVLDDADDLTPRRSRQGPNAFAESCGRRAPELAREVLRDEDVLPGIVEVGPGEVAAGDASVPVVVKSPGEMLLKSRNGGTSFSG